MKNGVWIVSEKSAPVKGKKVSLKIQKADLIDRKLFFKSDLFCSNLVFTNELGRHYAIFTFYKNFKRIAASIGRPDARPHDLRHTAATVAIASGADIKSVQDLLGHATASFTLDRYAHTSERMMKDTAQRMQDYYSTLETTKKS